MNGILSGLGGGFIAGCIFGAWIYSGQVAKRDIKMVRMETAQAMTDLAAQVSAKDLELEGLRNADESDTGERLDQANDYAAASRTVYRAAADLRRSLQKERTPYYEIEIPQNSIERLNCSLDASLCIEAAASAAEDNQGYPNGQDQHGGELAGKAPG